MNLQLMHIFNLMFYWNKRIPKQADFNNEPLCERDGRLISLIYKSARNPFSIHLMEVPLKSQNNDWTLSAMWLSMENKQLKK